VEINKFNNVPQVEKVKKPSEELKPANNSENNSLKACDELITSCPPYETGNAPPKISFDTPSLDQDEMEWYLEIKPKFETGKEIIEYIPTQKDLDLFKEITLKIKDKKPLPKGDINWSTAFERKIINGLGTRDFKPTPEETEKYNYIKEYLETNKLVIKAFETESDEQNYYVEAVETKE
jgi:hypothetical protein